MSATIILASASPRRQTFMRQLGIPFETMVADIDETPTPDEDPQALASRLASSKAQAVNERLGSPSERVLILASDTVVAYEGTILGKPADPADAARMLRLLRGRGHQVHTALAVLATHTQRLGTRLNTTTVVMRDYSDDEIVRYVESGDPSDKAGAYAIQHPIFSPVCHIDGCFSGVMGFPLGDLRDLLAEEGIALRAALPTLCEEHGSFRCCRR